MAIPNFADIAKPANDVGFFLFFYIPRPLRFLSPTKICASV